MKNFAQILAFVALSATVVSGRALPDASNALEARTPYQVVNNVHARSPKKGAAKASDGVSAAATTGTPLTAEEKVRLKLYLWIAMGLN